MLYFRFRSNARDTWFFKCISSLYQSFPVDDPKQMQEILASFPLVAEQMTASCFPSYAKQLSELTFLVNAAEQMLLYFL